MSVNKDVQWDFVKFLTTLNTFGEIPFLGSFRWIQTLLGQRRIFPGQVIDAATRKVFLFGQLPSSLVADLPNLPATTITHYTPDDLQTLRQDPPSKNGYSFCELIYAADTIIWCDNPDFHETDFSMLMNAVATCLSKNSDVVLERVFDFSQPESNLAAWGVLDDVVMGGVSEGGISLRPDDDFAYSALFSGCVSTDNSGGFSSVRTHNFEPPFGLEGWLGLRLRVKGDGQRYKFILRNSERWDSPAYIYSFDTICDEWIEVDVPFDALVPTFRAKSIPDAAPFNPAKVVSIQLMLSKFEYDRQLNPEFSPGPFSLAVRDISAYRARKGVPLAIIGAEGKAASQKAMLDEAEIPYRWIESEAADLERSIEVALQ